MMSVIWKFLAGGAGAAILFAATSWLVAQEVTEQIEPIEAGYEQFSETVTQMQFDKRNAEVMEERDVCLEEYPTNHCDEVAAWRWDVWYPYLNCASKVERYDERENACGPSPVKPTPPEEE